MPEQAGPWAAAAEDPAEQAPLRHLLDYTGDGVAEPGDDELVEWATVNYFGTQVRVCADPTTLEITAEEFIDLASTIDDEDGALAMGAVRQFLRAVVHPDDFGKFWRVVKVNRQGIVQQMAFAKAVVEVLTGRPIEPPSDSPHGQSTTAANYEADASLRAQQRLEAEGRGDLAYAVVQFREQREAVAAGQ